MPFDQTAQQVPWTNDVPRWLSLFIGYAEIAVGLGLIASLAVFVAWGRWRKAPIAGR